MQFAVKKMETALRLTQNIYNKKCMSKYTKLRHYKTVIKPECLYGAETLTLNRKKDIEEIQKKERKIIRKILGPKHNDQQTYRLRGNSEIRKYTDIHSDMKKRRFKFYAHIKRRDPIKILQFVLSI